MSDDLKGYEDKWKLIIKARNIMMISEGKRLYIWKSPLNGLRNEKIE